MTFTKPTKLCCVLLLLSVVSLTYVNGSAVKTDSQVVLTDSSPVTRDRNFNERSLRHLRIGKYTPTDEDDSTGENSEDRALESATLAELAKPVMVKISAKAKSLLAKLKTNDRKSADALFTQFKVTQNKKNPGVGEMAMVTTFTARYGDEGLAYMLVAAKNSYKTGTIAGKLGDAQLAKWLVGERTANGVFALLKLDEKGNKLFESAAVNSWISYVAKLGVKNPDETVFLALRRRKSREDDSWSQGRQEHDEYCQVVQRKHWVSEGKTTDDVFKLLELNKQGDKVLKTLS